MVKDIFVVEEWSEKKPKGKYLVANIHKNTLSSGLKGLSKSEAERIAYEQNVWIKTKKGKAWFKEFG